MQTFIYPTKELAREMAEKTVYMGYWYEIEPYDEPDSDFVYGRVQSYTGEGTMQDFAILLAATSDDDLEDLWIKLCKKIMEMVALINYQNCEK